MNQIHIDIELNSLEIILRDDSIFLSGITAHGETLDDCLCTAKVWVESNNGACTKFFEIDSFGRTYEKYFMDLIEDEFTDQDLERQVEINSAERNILDLDAAL